MMRSVLIVLWLLLSSTSSTVAAQVAVGVGIPGIRIAVNVPVYPQLVLVPGYPVYYAPQVDSNYFFYDGTYWVFQADNWYASAWYNGPWALIPPDAVPLFVLRVPVRYYRRPPVYFRGWSSNAPPRWGEHWGHAWEQQRAGWDRWNRAAAPAPAPLPTYQRQYSGARYPHSEQQPILQSQNYRYRPQEPVAQQRYAPTARPETPQRQAEPPAPTQRQVQPPPQPSPQRQAEQQPLRQAQQAAPREIQPRIQPRPQPSSPQRQAEPQPSRQAQQAAPRQVQPPPSPQHEAAQQERNQSRQAPQRQTQAPQPPQRETRQPPHPDQQQQRVAVQHEQERPKQGQGKQEAGGGESSR